MQITDKFDGCIEAICDSRLIIVDRAFSNLLRTLAATPEYLHVVREAASTTSFASELQKCTETGEFKLPKSNRSAVALTVGLLLEFEEEILIVIRILDIAQVHIYTLKLENRKVEIF